MVHVTTLAHGTSGMRAIRHCVSDVQSAVTKKTAHAPVWVLLDFRPFSGLRSILLVRQEGMDPI